MGLGGEFREKLAELGLSVNCGGESSQLKGLVKAFDKLHIVHGEKSLLLSADVRPASNQLQKLV